MNVLDLFRWMGSHHAIVYGICAVFALACIGLSRLDRRRNRRRRHGEEEYARTSDLKRYGLLREPGEDRAR